MVYYRNLTGVFKYSTLGIMEINCVHGRFSERPCEECQVDSRKLQKIRKLCECLHEEAHLAAEALARSILRIIKEKHEIGCLCDVFSDLHKDVTGYRSRRNWTCSEAIQWERDHYENDPENPKIRRMRAEFQRDD